jgi:hypothetical protein
MKKFSFEIDKYQAERFFTPVREKGNVIRTYAKETLAGTINH